MEGHFTIPEKRHKSHRILPKAIATSFLLIFLCCNIKAQRVIFAPLWTAQSQFAGYYAALANSYYQKVGLNVLVDYPKLSEKPYEKLESGDAQIGVLTLVEALILREKGVKLINVMQTSHINGLCIVGHKPLKDIHSVSNMTLGVWNHYYETLLNTFQRKFMLKKPLVRFNGGVNIFLSGAVDCCLMYTFNEIPQLKECGYRLNPNNVLRLAQNGLNIPEDGLYVTEQYYNKHKATIKKFVEASKSGWLWARYNREKALQYVMAEIKSHSIGTNYYHQKIQLDNILELQGYKKNDKNAFILTPEEFYRSINLLFPPGSAGRKIKYNDFVKNPAL